METMENDIVSSVMTDKVFGVTPQTSLDAALRLMTQVRVHHLPVIDGSRCLGLLHETDILWSLWTHGSTGQTAGSCSRAPRPLISPDDPVAIAAARMSQHGADAALVTAASGAIVGIITATDIVGYVARSRSVSTASSNSGMDAATAGESPVP